MLRLSKKLTVTVVGMISNSTTIAEIFSKEADFVSQRKEADFVS